MKSPSFVFFVFWQCALGAASCLGSTLYMTDTAGQLRTVDLSSGASTPVGMATGLVFSGLSSRPGDNTYLYAVHNRLAESGLARIHRRTGQATVYPAFSETTLGFPEPFSTAIAISPLRPGVAVVAGFNSDRDSPNRGEDFLWEVDLANGEVLGPAVRSVQFGALTYNLDGSVLLGTQASASSVDSAQLVTAAATTGVVTRIGSTNLSRSVEGLAFRPENAALMAIDAERMDFLVTLDPVTGALLERVGHVGVGGPDGLAFLVDVPEPSAWVLFTTLLVCLGNVRKAALRKAHRGLGAQTRLALAANSAGSR